MTTEKPEIIFRLNQSSLAIARYLVDQQLPNGDFPARNFYGRAFAGLLWSLHGKQFDRCIQKVINIIVEEHRRPLPANYHFEFNRFALIKLFQARPDLGTVDGVLGPERYTGTRVANWTLLRAYCRFQAGTVLGRLLGRGEVAAVRAWFSDRSGLIEDQRGAYTLQYHAFCVALLGELIAGPLKETSSVVAWFKKSADLLGILTLPGGQCNYVGRGSLQSFGYAAAILAFAHAYLARSDGRYLEKLNEVLAYLRRFQRPDGSLPLVLSETEEGDPGAFDLLNPAYRGWWSYNNFYDYLPFTGALLGLAAHVLAQSEPAESRSTAPSFEKRRCRGLLLIQKKGYTAVLALPNKVWASSLPMPFLALAGAFPLPCFGGEQGAPSLYHRRGLPLPVLELGDGREIYLAEAEYRWEGEACFCGELGGIRHRRRFEFSEDEFRVWDIVSWPQRLGVERVRAPRILISEKEVNVGDAGEIFVKGLSIRSDAPFEREKEIVFGPQGPLNVFFIGGPSVSEARGTTFSCETIFSLRLQEQSNPDPDRQGRSSS